VQKQRPWWHWAVVIFIGLVILGAIFGEDEDEGSGGQTAAEVQSEATPEADEAEETPTATPTPDPKQLVAQALTAVRQDRYKKAEGIVEGLGRKAVLKVEKAISDRLGKRASGLVRRGANTGAKRLLAQARRYPSTASVRSAQGALDSALALIAQRKADRRAARQAAREAAQAPPSVPSGPCYSISATDFPVPPGDDRDADGDGIACESS
jgi:hypothetical protein